MTCDLTVLLVDDDPVVRAFTAESLGKNGYRTLSAGSGAVALELLADAEATQPDIVLLDLMMPVQSGWDVLREIRARGLKIPVIVVTARESVEERVQALELGADDYVIKPFAFEELAARIQAVIRRGRDTDYSLDGLVLDAVRRQATHAEQTVDLSPKETDLLRVLLEEPHKTLSRADLLERAWGFTHDPGTNVVEVHIGRLRRKLESIDCRSLQTVRGAGYRLSND